MRALNPYESPSNSDDSIRDRTRSNPAQLPLYLFGVLAILVGVVGVPVGLFVGPQILGVAAAILTFGVTAFWLGHRKFDHIGRWATVSWGATGVLLIVSATVFQSPSTDELPGIVFFGFLLLMFAAVSTIALSTRHDLVS